MVTRDGKIHAKAQIERTSAPGPHCRGYARVATTATCGLLRGQYRVALANWEGRSAKARETTLIGSFTFWFIRRPGCPLDPLEGTAHRKLASMLNRLGFQNRGRGLFAGLAVSARRRNTLHMAVAA